MTTSAGREGACAPRRKMYRFMRTLSFPGAGTPDVKTCSATARPRVPGLRPGSVRSVDAPRLPAQDSG